MPLIREVRLKYCTTTVRNFRDERQRFIHHAQPMHKAPVYTTSLTASSEAVASANKSKGAVLYVSEDCQV